MGLTIALTAYLLPQTKSLPLFFEMERMLNLERLGEEAAGQITAQLWDRPVVKKEVQGIHGTLFYELTNKKRYYPTKKESEMVPLGTE